MLKIYGIPNCDTVKKALTWLKQNDIAYTFHDYKKEGISTAKIKKWCGKLGWQTVFNNRSSTWKNIKNDYASALDESTAIAIMQEHTSIIKRPIIEYNHKIISGFNENEYIEIILAQ